MWCALRVLAGLQTLPKPLSTGDRICGVKITNQVRHGPPMLRFHGTDGSRAYNVDQFYSIDTGAFLCWQNEARFASLPQDPDLLWPSLEWAGGVLTPRPAGESLADRWQEVRSPEAALSVARGLARVLARMHAMGIAHLRLGPRVVHYRPRHEQVQLSSFTIARRNGWDDFWTDSFPPLYDTAWVAPEVLRGERGDERADVFGFGCLLVWLLTGRPPFGSLRRAWRELAHARCPARLPLDAPGHDPVLLPLAHACLAVEPDDRPDAAEIAHIMGVSLPDPAPVFSQVPDRKEEASHPAKQEGPLLRIMAFAAGDDKAAVVMEQARSRAIEQDGIVLFVGLVPVNLPSGHLERFKAALFAEMGQALWHCRRDNVRYGLRILENVAPARTAEALVRRYEPDVILVGEPSTISRIRGGVVPRLQRLDTPVHIVGANAAGAGAESQAGANKA